jgi:multidrug efflux pump subunit AcrA (membrane-fusion protein)
MLSAVLLSGCGESNTVDQNDTTTNIIRPAKLLKLGQTTHDHLLNYPAVIEVSQQSQLAFQVSGKVEKLLVRDSDDVKQGDVIAQIDKLDYQSKLNVAKAQFDNASAEYGSAKKLIGTNVISRSEFAKKKQNLK